MPKRVLTREILMADARKGIPASETARRMGVAVASVYDARVRLGLTHRPTEIRETGRYGAIMVASRLEAVAAMMHKLAEAGDPGEYQLTLEVARRG